MGNLLMFLLCILAVVIVSRDLYRASKGWVFNKFNVMIYIFISLLSFLEDLTSYGLKFFGKG